MHSGVYSDVKIKKAIKSYYNEKVSELGTFFRNGDIARKVITDYLNKATIPDDSSVLNFLSIVFSDLDPELYNLSYKDKRLKLQQIHKEHFSTDSMSATIEIVSSKIQDRVRSMPSEDIE